MIYQMFNPTNDGLNMNTLAAQLSAYSSYHQTYMDNKWTK